MKSFTTSDFSSLDNKMHSLMACHVCVCVCVLGYKCACFIYHAGIVSVAQEREKQKETEIIGVNSTLVCPVSQAFTNESMRRSVHSQVSGK